MESLYEQNKSFSEIADEFGMTTSKVEWIFRKNNIKVRKNTVSEKFRRAMDERRIFLPKDKLAELYTDKKLSIQKIAEQLNTSNTVVRKNLLNYKIPIRSRSPIKSPLTVELLTRLYIDQKLSAKEVAAHLGYSRKFIGKKLSLLGIRKFGVSASIRWCRIN